MEEWLVVFDLMPDGISIHDADFTILDANKALCRMLGRAKEEIVGHKCYRIFHGLDSPIDGCVFEKTSRSKTHRTEEMFEPSVDMWLAVTSSPILDEAGKCIRSIHIIRDVTERKNAEEARDKMLIDHLEALSLEDGLEGLLAICASCKMIRKDDGSWEQIEVYIRKQTGTEFSHGMCPGCIKKLYPELDITKDEGKDLE